MAGDANGRGIGLPCPKCGDATGLRVNVYSLGVECARCHRDVSRDELVAYADGARRLVRWINLAAQA